MRRDKEREVEIRIKGRIDAADRFAYQLDDPLIPFSQRYLQDDKPARVIVSIICNSDTPKDRGVCQRKRTRIFNMVETSRPGAYMFATDE